MKHLTTLIKSGSLFWNGTSKKSRFLCTFNGKQLEVVVSTLRVDRVASSGLGISRRHVDLAFLAKLLYLNGDVVTKKSTQVTAGDVIDLIRKDDCTDELVKFDSVKVLEMVDKTLKGKERVLLSRKRGVCLEWNQFKDRFDKKS